MYSCVKWLERPTEGNRDVFEIKLRKHRFFPNLAVFKMDFLDNLRAKSILLLAIATSLRIVDVVVRGIKLSLVGMGADFGTSKREFRPYYKLRVTHFV